MIYNKNFATFILTYGRAEKVYTYETLKKQNYTGNIYFVCSEDDKELFRYKELYKEKVMSFKKTDYKSTFDIGDNFNDDKVVVYARNAVFDIAKKLGYEYFLVLDDDYTELRYTRNENQEYLTKSKKLKNLDIIFDILLEYYKKTNVKALCIAQGGDFIGGENSRVFINKLTRKAMNFFICSTNRPFKFVGRINEDVNTYVRQGAQGDIFQTICDLRLEQLDTQSNTGGLTEFYLSKGTYVKSFYTVLFSPSCININLMGNKNKRLHHRVKWNNAVPKIIEEKYKK
jgi:YHS domain-containing protein